MSDNEDIPTIVSRIARAERDRDRFLAVKMSERYLEACSAVESLRLQLTRQYAALRARREDDRMLADFRIAERIANNARRTWPTYPETDLAFGIT